MPLTSTADLRTVWVRPSVAMVRPRSEVSPLGVSLAKEETHNTTLRIDPMCERAQGPTAGTQGCHKVVQGTPPTLQNTPDLENKKNPLSQTPNTSTAGRSDSKRAQRMW